MPPVTTVMATVTDLQLMQRIAAGDGSAFAALYDRHAARLLRSLVRWVGDRAAAEDVLQESFFQLWRRARQYDAGRAPPGAWLFLLARSRALDYLRHRRPGPEVEPPADVECDPARLLEHAESSRRVREALGRLPVEQRDALMMAFYGGLTHEQVAAALAVPLGTAKTRIRLGIRRLRQALADELGPTNGGTGH